MVSELVSLAEDPLASPSRAAQDDIHGFPSATQDPFKSHHHTGQGSAISSGVMGEVVQSREKQSNPDKRRGGVTKEQVRVVILLKAVVKEI